MAEDRISEIEPNWFGLAAAKLLRGAKEGLNWPGKLPESIPLLGGMGAGDMLMGQGPELAEDLAYGFSKSRGKGMTYGLDPRAVYLALSPAPYATAAKGGQFLLRKSLQNMATEGGTDVGRRKFLGQVGALGATAAVGASVPSILKPLLAETMAKVSPPAAVAMGKSGILSLAERLGAASVRWATELGPKFLNEAGWQTYTDKNLVDQMLELIKSPTYESSLSKAMGDATPELVDSNLLSKLHSQQSHNEFYRGTEREVDVGFSDFGPEYGAKYGTEEYGVWAKAYQEHDKALVILRERIASDAKTLSQFEELILTGKLPKGANPKLADVDPNSLPETSKLSDLLEETRTATGRALGDE